MGNALRESWWSRTYEGAQKSVPSEALLEMMAQDVDQKEIEKLGRLSVDRRLRTRDDLSEAENDPFITTEFLVGRGCDRVVAERLLERVRKFRHQMTMASSPAHRLMLLVARQMT